MYNKKNKIIAIMIVAVLLMATGYAYFATNLTITTTGNISTEWSVKFTAMSEGDANGTKAETLLKSFTDTSATISVDFKAPGDEMTYELTLSNTGDIGAVIENINVNETGTDAIVYSISGIEMGDRLAGGSTTTVVVKMQYDPNITSQPSVTSKTIIVSIDAVQDIGQQITPQKTYETVAQLGWQEASSNGATTVEELRAGVISALEDNGYNVEDYGIIVTTNGVEIAEGWLQNDTIVTKGYTTVAIGDFVNYTYDTASAYSLPKELSGYDTDQTISQRTDLSWVALGATEDGELELLSLGLTPEIVALKNVAGYNNGVYILNDIAKTHYSNSSLGAVARSLNIEDIEKQFSAEAIAARDGYIQENSGIKYGSTKAYGTGHNSYPLIYAQEALSGATGSIREGGIGRSDSYYTSISQLNNTFATASGELVATQTYYAFDNTPSSYFKNEVFYNYIFVDQATYWLASREQVAGPNNVGFGLFRINSTTSLIGAEATFNSGEVVTQSTGNKMKPVVTIPRDVTVTTNNQANSGSNRWQLSK